jgi:hypothetical protein
MAAEQRERCKVAAAQREGGRQGVVKASGRGGSNAGVRAALASVGRRRSKRGAERGREGAWGLSEIGKGVFSKISGTSLNSGRREYLRTLLDIWWGIPSK